MQTLNINGVKVSLIPDNRLKTAAVTVYISLPLKKETASKNAVWPAILMRGTKNHPETKELSICMETLWYGFCNILCGINGNRYKPF